MPAMFLLHSLHHSSNEMKPVIFSPFKNRNGSLHFEETDLIETAREIGTPYIAMSEARIRDNYRRIFKAFHSKYSNFAIRYAVKANSNLAIIAVLRQEGSGADSSTVDEVRMAMKAGITAKEIAYTPNNASAEELNEAVNLGVHVNFDDIGQMNLIGSNLPHTVSFRVNPGIGGGEFKGIVTAGPRTKFGMPPEAVIPAYRQAKELGAKKFGMQMMAGSNVLDWKHFDIISKAFLDLAGRISQELGIRFSYLDLGGGFGVPYKTEQSPLDIEKAADAIVTNLKEACEKYGMDEPQLLIEPGRYLVADSGVIIGRVTNIKSYDANFIGTDVGMNILLRPALYGAYHHIVIANKLDSELDYRGDVVGQICESTDKIGVDIGLSKPEIGDYIAVFNAGAYVSSMSSNYNGHAKPAEILLRKGAYDIIRLRETFSDLVKGNVVPKTLDAQHA